MWPRLASRLQQCSCLCLPSAKILGVVLFVSVVLSRAETQGLAYASQTVYLSYTLAFLPIPGNIGGRERIEILQTGSIF